jgi:hypothetical protein
MPSFIPFLELTADTLTSKFRSNPTSPDGRYEFEVSQDPRIRATGGHSSFTNNVNNIRTLERKGFPNIFTSKILVRDIPHSHYLSILS